MHWGRHPQSGTAWSDTPPWEDTPSGRYPTGQTSLLVRHPQASQSFCSQGGVCIPARTGADTPVRNRLVTWSGTPRADTPTGQIPSGQTHPQADTPLGRHPPLVRHRPDLSVILFTIGCLCIPACNGADPPPVRPTLGRQPQCRPPPPTATAADGTHPTVMHSCFIIYLTYDILLKPPQCVADYFKSFSHSVSQIVNHHIQWNDCFFSTYSKLAIKIYLCFVYFKSR